MISGIFTICLLTVAVFAQTEPPTSQPPTTDQPKSETEVISAVVVYEDDGFVDLTTVAARKKRSAVHSGGFLGQLGGYSGGNYGGGYAGGNAGGYGGYAAGCGAYPATGTNFVRCFTPGNGYYASNTLYRNYYRQGNYGNCLNYFNSLPLSNVASTATGYSGRLTLAGNRAYNVDACRSCYNGNPGISFQGVGSPNGNLVRQFIFRVGVSVEDGGYSQGGYGGNGGYRSNGGYGYSAGYGRYGSNYVPAYNYGYPQGSFGRVSCNGADCSGYAGHSGCTPGAGVVC
ncbi:hypothetical protein LOTGIDRAFT_229237 [Lottia gigantea]|uniref:Uncharacterized protein n=1 Tax=Lottia gigantea TaxID=225164 RepID=V3Z856_LOTGI|nr:hypothetical protein LOTGIDRAFT_229237 [Lottia gigantea]ESO87033.1 hypothetical protein LOTGIDRAFT_229237 [Lottia gigantea]